MRVGSTEAELRLRRAVGSRPLLLAVGTTEVELFDSPLPGMTTYVGGLQGELTLPLVVPPGLVGLSIFHQAFIFDPGATGGLSSSNALEIVYGP